MKQTNSKKFESIDKKPGVKAENIGIGSMSVVGLLKELSKTSNKNLGRKISEIFLPNYQKFNSISISNQNALLKLFESHYINVDTYLQSIQESLINYMQNAAEKDRKPASASVVKFLKGDNYAQSLLIEMIGIMETIVAMQQSIMTMLGKIYTYLPELKPTGKTTIKQFNQSTKEYIEFLNILGKLDKVVSKDFVKRFGDLTTEFLKFIDKKNSTALIIVGVQLTRFTRVLSILGIVLKKTRRIFRSLAMTLIILALTITMPPFAIAMTMLFAITYKLQATFNPKFAFGFTRSVNAIRNALIGMVVSMFLMDKVNVNAFYKVIGCLIIMAGVIRLLTKAQGHSGKGGVKMGKVIRGDNSGNTSIGGLGGLAFGLAFIVLALDAASELKWGPVIKLIVFLTVLIGLLMLASKSGVNWGPAVFNKRTQKTGQSLFDGLFKLSLGIAILLLCADAATEVKWVGAAMIIGFILAIGIVLFTTAKMTKQSRFGGPFQGIFGFAMGVAILLLCADAVREIDWLTAGKLVLFIAAISFAIHAPEMIMGMKGKKFMGRGGRMSGMFGFAVGLAIIIITLASTKDLNMKKAFQVILFISAMVFITNKAKGIKDVKQLKGGIGMLLMVFGATIFIISLASRLIKPGQAAVAVALTIATIYGMGHAIRYAYNKLGRLKNLVTLAEHMSLFLLMAIGSVIALSLINKNPANIVLYAATMFGIMYGIVKLIDYINKHKKQIMALEKFIVPFGLFIGITLAACYLISEIPFNMESTLTYFLSVGLFIGITYLAGKLEKTLKKGAGILIIIGVAMIVFAFAVKKIMEIQLNLEATLTYVGTILIMGGICAILGIPAVSALVGLGAVVLVGLSLAVLLSATFISLATQLSFNTENITNFAISIELISKAFGSNLGWIILGIAAAALFAIIAVTSILTATALLLISIMPLSEEKINIFSESIKTISLAYGENIGWIFVGVIAAALFAVIAGITIITAIALMLISVIPVKLEKIVLFGVAMVSLVDAYNELGLFSTAKAVAKCLLLLPIASSSLLVALALKAISMLDIDSVKIDKFGVIVDKFVTVMCEITDRNRDKILKNQKAFQVIADMANAASSIVNVVEAMANMTVAQWGVDKKTGELKIIGRRQINDNDFDLVCRNMGKMMAALIAPLSIIASNDNEWDFGNGIKVKNPFSKVDGFFGPKDDMSGVNRIKAIGDAFEKIPAIMQGFCNNPLLTDVSEEGSKKMQKLQENIGIFFDTIILCMNKLPQKSVLDSWFDGTASWLQDTVKPVFEAATDIIKKITPGGKEGTTKWEYSKTPLCLSNVLNFWSTTALIAAKAEETKKKKFDSGIATKVIDFYSEIEKLKDNQWLSSDNMQSTAVIANNTKILINSLADASAFNRITKNLQNTNKNVQAIVTNINKINIAKAGALERNLRLLTQAKTQEALRDVIEELKEMIGLLKEVQEKQVQATVQQTKQQQIIYDEEKERKEVQEMSEKEKQEEITRILKRIENYLTSNGLTVDLTEVNQEIEQALYNCGLVTDNDNNRNKYSKMGIK